MAYMLLLCLEEDVGGTTSLTSPSVPWTISWASYGPLSPDPSPARGILILECVSNIALVFNVVRKNELKCGEQ